MYEWYVYAGTPIPPPPHAQIAIVRRWRVDNLKKSRASKASGEPWHIHLIDNDDEREWASEVQALGPSTPRRGDDKEQRWHQCRVRDTVTGSPRKKRRQHVVNLELDSEDEDWMTGPNTQGMWYMDDDSILI